MICLMEIFRIVKNIRANCFFLFLLAFFSLFSVSCNYGFYPALFGEESVESRASSIDLLDEEFFPDVSAFSSPKKYSFVVMTDVHIGNALHDVDAEGFLSWLEKQMQDEDVTKRPLFALSLGDNADGGHESEYKAFNEFSEKMRAIAKDAGVPSFRLYSTIGNHDVYNNGWENFKEIVFPYKSAYRFAEKNSDGNGFSYYVLDSANGTLGEAQRKALKSAFENDPNPKLVFTHYPLYADGITIYTMQDTMERNLLLTLFTNNNVVRSFEGHAHRAISFEYGSWGEDVSPAFGFDDECRLVTVDSENLTVTSSIIDF